VPFQQQRGERHGGERDQEAGMGARAGMISGTAV
jgi:hypothetical protein